MCIRVIETYNWGTRFKVDDWTAPLRLSESAVIRWEEYERKVAFDAARQGLPST